MSFDTPPPTLFDDNADFAAPASAALAGELWSWARSSQRLALLMA